jgi:LuxR family maltose regulon positive regulatory protein
VGIGDPLLEILRVHELPANDTLFSNLIGEISKIPERFIIVLDDFHLITEVQIHDGFSYLLDHLAASQMHLIVATRLGPPWHLARLRTLKEISEVRVKNLRFTTEETTLFLNEVMGLSLSSREIMELGKRTTGWVAGLQMAVLYLKGRSNIPGLVKDFAGSNRFIFDYLIEEVLANQTPEITQFLLKTSILDRISIPLCDSVLGIDNSSEIIGYLDQANLFLTSLDDKKQWYRYHRFFRELLQLQLERLFPDQTPALHRKASQWLAENDRIVDAVGHAVHARDQAQIAHLIERNALEMVHHRELKTLRSWLDRLPEEMIRDRPWLSIAYAWVLVNSVQFDRLDFYLQNAEAGKDLLEGTEKNRLLGHIYAVRA